MINNDEEINILDMLGMKKYILGTFTPKDLTTFLKTADLNGDGNINISDASYLKKYILQLITEFPVETASTITPLKEITSKDCLNHALTLINTATSNENAVLSPCSLKLALGMLANGATGITQKEILQAMGNVDLASYNEIAKGIMNTFDTHSENLQMANSIWFNEDCFKDSNIQFAPAYVDLIKDTYCGDSYIVNNDNAVKTINGWISEKTAGKIKGVLDNPEFLSVLVNTIYFKDKWKSPFIDNEFPLPFHDIDGNTSEASFMHESNMYLPYYEDENLQLVQLDYENSDVSMFIALPKTDLSVLTGDSLDLAISQLKAQPISIRIPRFKMNFGKSLTKTLQALGMKAAFSPVLSQIGSNMFQGIDGEYGVYVSDVIQKNFIAVDSAGTEAASATVIIDVPVGCIESPKPIPSFIADKPFTYFIRENLSGEILFIGNYLYGNVMN